ncbi:hypothetical protein BDZ91DRAFT_786334 [Kalaharituber pfeilii]|nr:hypothetical protein BDZ91DRAFT_786334 [Kalaharituber pfeilii]
MGNWTAGVLCGMRLATFTCMFMVGGNSAAYAQSIRGNFTVRHPPHPPELMIATVLGTVFGCIGGSWSFVTFVPCAIASTAHSSSHRYMIYLFISALVDLMLTVGLALAAVEQAKYLPRPLGMCRNLEQLKPDHGNGKSYFDLLGELLYGENGDPIGAENICKGFVLVWKLEIAMAVLSGIACLIASHSIFMPPLIDYLLKIFTPVKVGISYLRYWTRASQRRAGRRHARRAIETEKAQIELAKQRRSQAAADAEVGIRNYGEKTMLGSYGIATALAKGCHHADFRSLMRVSRAVRAAAAGAMAIEVVRKVTCSAGSKGQCWSCGEQICRDCTNSQTVHRGNEVSFHLNCKPHCSGCYRRKFCYQRPRLMNDNNRWWWVSTPNLCYCDKQRLGVADTYELENDQMVLLERRQARGAMGADHPEGAAQALAGGQWRCLDSLVTRCVECGRFMKRNDASRVWWCIVTCLSRNQVHNTTCDTSE